MNNQNQNEQIQDIDEILQLPIKVDYYRPDISSVKNYPLFSKLFDIQRNGKLPQVVGVTQDVKELVVYHQTQHNWFYKLTSHVPSEILEDIKKAFDKNPITREYELFNFLFYPKSLLKRSKIWHKVNIYSFGFVILGLVVNIINSLLGSPLIIGWLIWIFFLIAYILFAKFIHISEIDKFLKNTKFLDLYKDILKSIEMVHKQHLDFCRDIVSIENDKAKIHNEAQLRTFKQANDAETTLQYERNEIQKRTYLQQLGMTLAVNEATLNGELEQISSNTRRQIKLQDDEQQLAIQEKQKLQNLLIKKREQELELEDNKAKERLRLEIRQIEIKVKQKEDEIALITKKQDELQNLEIEEQSIDVKWKKTVNELKAEARKLNINDPEKEKERSHELSMSLLQNLTSVMQKQAEVLADEDQKKRELNDQMTRTRMLMSILSQQGMNSPEYAEAVKDLFDQYSAPPINIG